MQTARGGGAAGEPASSCSGACACSRVPAAPTPDPVVPRRADESAPWGGAIARSVFHIPGMDCPSEEQMVRMRLADLPVAALAFDLPARRLVVDHGGTAADILARLEPLGFGAQLAESRALTVDEARCAPPADDAAEARALWVLLAINAAMFVVELGAGIWARSAGLIADAMDMFADAAVYGVALYAVGRAAAHKLGAARLAGVLQLLLALAALAETVRRMMTGALPEAVGMMGIALLALAANVACLLIIARHRHGGAHMRASYIFSANDVIANVGVIAAGALVAWTGSAWPDWIIGLVIGAVVLAGAVRILRLR